MDVIIIGIDCATKPNKVGLAQGIFSNNKVTLQKSEVGRPDSLPKNIISDWLQEVRRTKPVLLALDAPLGWPTMLGKALKRHSAGQYIPYEPDELFNRQTDKIIKKEIGKSPLEVGADRIARTALAALTLLKDIGNLMNEPIPVLTANTDFNEPIAAIEVYPAATLKAYALPDKGYKNSTKNKKEAKKIRQEILSEIKKCIELPEDTSPFRENDNLLDAALCVLAAYDFLRGDIIPPENEEMAKKEGWIWVKKPNE